MEGIRGKREVLVSQGFPTLLLVPLSTSEADKGRRRTGPKCAFLFPIHLTRCAERNRNVLGRGS